MFGVMRVINLAHGSLSVLAAYLIWTVAERWGISPFIALVVVLPIMALAGWVLQRTVLEPGLQSGPPVPLLSTFALAAVLGDMLFERFGAVTQSLASDIAELAF